MYMNKIHKNMEGEILNYQQVMLAQLRIEVFNTFRRALKHRI